MKFKFLNSYLVLFLVIAIQGMAQESVSKTNVPVCIASIEDYDRWTLKLNQIVTQTVNPKQLEMTFENLLSGSALVERDQDKFAKKRVEMAGNILTNLSLLEDGLRRTGIFSDVSLRSPPPMAALPEGDRTAIDSVSDPEARKLLLAYRSVWLAYASVWNLHQALQAEQRRHGNKAIGAVAGAYSRPPRLGDPELKKMLANYRGYDFALQISNRLFSAQSQPK